MNHTRARARSPRRAGPGRAVAVAETRRGAAGRPDGRCGARARARPDVTSLASPSRAGPGRGRGRGRDEARRGRPAGRAVRCACAAGRDVQVPVRCDVMAILPLTAINRAIKRAIKSVINGHNRIT